MKYTENEINNAREYAAQLPLECANEAKINPDFLAAHLTSEEKNNYIVRMTEEARKINLGMMDDNFTIWQRMNFFLTGEMVPFFPPYNDIGDLWVK